MERMTARMMPVAPTARGAEQTQAIIGNAQNYREKCLAISVLNGPGFVKSVSGCLCIVHHSDSGPNTRLKVRFPAMRAKQATDAG
jgi:hypothetical protein